MGELWTKHNAIDYLAHYRERLWLGWEHRPTKFLVEEITLHAIRGVSQAVHLAAG